MLHRTTPARVRARSKAPAAPSDSGPAPATSNDGERLRLALGYLQRAHALLRAGKPNGALAQLGELDQRVPEELLEEERDVTRALALCDSGETKRASSVAQRVLDHNPGSVYARSLRDSCIGHERVLEEMRRRASKASD
jgi:hypothetical protein